MLLAALLISASFFSFPVEGRSSLDILIFSLLAGPLGFIVIIRLPLIALVGITGALAPVFLIVYFKKILFVKYIAIFISIITWLFFGYLSFLSIS